jgi:hypothetical protein
MVRTLSKEEIEKWNNRLEKSSFKIYFDLSTYKFQAQIFKDIVNGFPITNAFNLLDDPKNDAKLNRINYKLSFSVTKKRQEDFLFLINKFKSEGFLNEEIVIDNIIQQTPIHHNLYGVDFVKYDIQLFEPIFKTIAIVTIVEDAIDFIQQMYGVNDSGEEINLLNYTKGSIVSIKDNKSTDYMINDYVYVRNTVSSKYQALGNNIKNHIKYELVCIDIENVKSSVICYGDSVIVSEDQIIPSRTNNLNIIFN